MSNKRNNVIKKKRTIIVYVLIMIMIGNLLLFISACIEKTEHNTPQDENMTDLTTKEEIAALIRSKYFDENGKAITEYWEKGMRLNGINDYEMPEITGFDIHFIKDARTKEEDWFLVEFEPIGYYLGCRRFSAHKHETLGSWPLINDSFDYSPSPYKLLNIPYEEAYCYSLRLFVLIEDAHYRAEDGEEMTGPLMEEIGAGKGLEYLRIGGSYEDLIRRYGKEWIDYEGDTLNVFDPEYMYRIKSYYVQRPLYGKYDPLEDHKNTIKQFINEYYR